MSGQSGLFTASVIANLLGISERRLRQLHDAGYVPKAEHGLYPLVGSVQGYIRYLRELARKPRASANEHQRLLRAQAIRIEMENARRRGELVLAAQVEDLLYTLSAELGAQLDGMAGRYASQMLNIQEPARAREILLDGYREVRLSVAQKLEAWAASREREARAEGAEDEGDADELQTNEGEEGDAA